MATVTPEQMKKALSSLSALEGMASGYCELQDGFDTSKGIAENVRQVLAALASPPASDPPGLAAALKAWQEAHARWFREGKSFGDSWFALKAAEQALLAYDLTAPAPMPTKGDE